MSVVEDGDQTKASSRATDAGAAAGAGAFGPNAWLVEDMYDRYLADPTSVSDSWREFFADYRPAGASPSAPTSAPTARPTVQGGGVTGAASPASRGQWPPTACGGGRRRPGRSITGRGVISCRGRAIGARRYSTCGPARRWRRRCGHSAARRRRPDRGQHGGLAVGTHGDQCAGGAGQAPRSQPHDHQQPAVPDQRGQGQLHPSDRLRGGQEPDGRPGHERLLRR